MASGIGTVQVKRMKGKITVLAMGKTPKGQQFIREMRPLLATKVSDPDFKKELAAAVADLFA